MITGNKGEWSEIYSLLKLLGDRKLYTGDANLNKVESLFYPIIKIIRDESGGNFEYLIDGDIVLISGEKEMLRVPITTFSQEAVKLLNSIKESIGVFSIPETEAFMKSIYCTSLKAKSTSKSDIRIVIHDQQINQTSELGFSIKSKLGGDSTLLNAGKTTNFIFTLTNISLTDSQIDTINTIESRSKIKDRIIKINDNGGQLLFRTLENNIFKNNLILIDSSLPHILSEIILLFYTSNLSSVKLLCEKISALNPLNFDTQHSHSFYEYKIKRFLADVALGMMPSKVWSGQYDATGGYLIVKEDGDVLCYHIYNRNQFEEYLFENTKLETASSTRHDFGKITKHSDTELTFKLNLQIRFI
jgi:hypothetical protein